MDTAWIVLILLIRKSRSLVSLERCARTIHHSYQKIQKDEATVESFVESAVEALTMGYSLRMLLLELEAIDDEAKLTPLQRSRRRDWLTAIRYTLDTLTNSKHNLHSIQDAELAGVVRAIVSTQTVADRGVQLHHALESTTIHRERQDDNKSDDVVKMTSNTTIGNHVSLPHLILLTLKYTWELEADQSYPGATG